MKQLGKKAKGLLLLVLCVALILPCANGHALTQKQKALNAYKRFLSKSKVNVLAPGTTWYENFRPRKYTPTNAAKVKFGIAYIDNDNIPEMVLLGKVNKYGKRDDIFAVFTYRNGKVVRVKSGNYDFMRFGGYYSRTGTFKYLFYDDGGEAEHNYCMLRNGKTSEKIRKWVPGEWAASQGVKCNYYKLVSTKKVKITYTNGQKSLVIMDVGEVDSVPSSYAISASNPKLANGSYALEFQLILQSLEDIFLRLCWDIIDYSNKSSQPLKDLINRYLSWQKLLKQLNKKELSFENQKGLLE